MGKEADISKKMGLNLNKTKDNGALSDGRVEEGIWENREFKYAK